MTATTTAAPVAPLSPAVSKRPPTPLMLDTLASIGREIAREAARGRGERAAYYPVQRSVLGLESRGLIVIGDNPHGGPDARITITRAGVDVLSSYQAEQAAIKAADAPTPTPAPAPTPAPLPSVQVTDAMRAMLVRVGVECLANRHAKAYAPSNQSLAALERRGALIATRNDCGGVMPRVEFTEIGLATLARTDPDLARRVREHIAAAPPAAEQAGGVTLATEIEYDNGVRTSVWLRCAERSAEGPSLCLRYEFQGPGHRGHAKAFCALVSRKFANATDAIKALDAARDFNVCGHSKLKNGVELSFCAMLHGVETWSPDDDTDPETDPSGSDDAGSESAEVDSTSAEVDGQVAADTSAAVGVSKPNPDLCCYCARRCPRGVMMSTDGDVAHRACAKQQYDPDTLREIDRATRRQSRELAATRAAAPVPSKCYACDAPACGTALRDKDGGPCKGDGRGVKVPACSRHTWTDAMQAKADTVAHSVGFGRSGTLCGERKGADTVDVGNVTCPKCKARIADSFAALERARNEGAPAEGQAA